MNTSSYRLVTYMLKIIQILILTYGTRGNHNKRQQAIPRFLPEETNVTFHRGETAILRCKIENLGPKLVNWRKVSDGYPITVGKLVFTPAKNIELVTGKLNETVTQWNLEIKNVDMDHAGLYECQISSTESYTFNITLNVLNSSKPDTSGYPRRIPHRDHPYYETRDQYGNRGKSAISLTGTQYVNLYQMINLTCNATGPERAPESVDWFHEGHKITADRDKWKGRLSIHNYYGTDYGFPVKYQYTPGRSFISRLVINRSMESDAGTYICRSTPNVETTSIKVHVLNDNKTVFERDNISLTGTEYVNLFQTIKLTCNATGPERAPEFIDWFHNGFKVTTEREKWKNRLTIRNFYGTDNYGYSGRHPGRSLISRLIIKRSNKDDAGSYVCRSTPNVQPAVLKVHVLNDNKPVSERDTKQELISAPKQNNNNNHNNNNAAKQQRLSNCLLALVILLLLLR